MARQMDPQRATHRAQPENYRVIIKLDERWRGTQPDGADVLDRVRKHIERVTTSALADEDAQDREAWGGLVSAIPDLRLELLLPEPLIVALLRRSTTVGQEPPWLTRYLTLVIPAHADTTPVLMWINRLSFVERAYIEPPGSDPQFVPDDPLVGNQGYLEPADGGIDARFLWDEMLRLTGSLPGINMGLVDLEQGWTLNHADLPIGIQRVGTGGILDASRAHGTAVLGIVGAVPNNNFRCIGIAPAVSCLKVVSYAGSTRLTAIYEAANALDAGDVLLIESQVLTSVIVGGAILQIPLAIEIDPQVRGAIRDDVIGRWGIVVVETAGNGGTDLGAVQTVSGDDFSQDSGAILVSGSTSAAPHKLSALSNYGAPISCYAWGENVTTLWSDKAGDRGLFTHSFSNTSAAAAIVAGAAVSLQSMHKAVKGVPLPPAQMRQVLRAHGTPPATTEPRPMGMMPDLRKAAIALSLAPQAAPAAPTGLRIVT